MEESCVRLTDSLIVQQRRGRKDIYPPTIRVASAGRIFGIRSKNQDSMLLLAASQGS